jgi:hypothetical protein
MSMQGTDIMKYLTHCKERNEKSTQKFQEMGISYKYYLKTLYNLLAYRITRMNTRIAIAILVSAIIASTAAVSMMTETALAQPIAAVGGGCGQGGCGGIEEPGAGSGRTGGGGAGGVLFESGNAGGGGGGGYGSGGPDQVKCGEGGGGSTRGGVFTGGSGGSC